MTITTGQDILAADFLQGWYQRTETWTYASASTFTVTGDITSYLAKGMKIRWKQGGAYQYAYVVGFSYSAPDTTVTISVSSDYTLSNAAITDNYYGVADNPIGFPSVFNSAPSTSGWAATPTTTWAKFSISGAMCTFFIKITGTSNAQSTTCSLPVSAAGGMDFLQAPCFATDNGILDAALGRCIVSFAGGASTLQFYRSAGAFATSGTKVVEAVYIYQF